MNEQQTELLRELAAKFGTTAEHLWGVLVKQAPISSTVDLLVIAGWMVLLGIGAFLIRKNTKPDPDGGYRDDELKMIMWTVWGLCFFVFTSVAGCSMALIISGFFNPEYWALQQIMP